MSALAMVFVVLFVACATAALIIAALPRTPARDAPIYPPRFAEPDAEAEPDTLTAEIAAWDGAALDWVDPAEADVYGSVGPNTPPRQYLVGRREVLSAD